MGPGGVWEISIPPSQFCCKPKTSVNTKTLKNVTERTTDFHPFYIFESKKDSKGNKVILCKKKKKKKPSRCQFHFNLNICFIFTQGWFTVNYIK